MMEDCRNCIHYNVCISHEECKDFKNKTRFVELPCKIGDIIYCPYKLYSSEQWEIDEWVVTEISFVNYHVGYLFDKDGNLIVGNKENQIKIQLVLSDNSKFKGGPVDSICISPDDLGEGFYISYEKAEQAIKEHGKNARNFFRDKQVDKVGSI